MQGWKVTFPLSLSESSLYPLLRKAQSRGLLIRYPNLSDGSGMCSGRSPHLTTIQTSSYFEFDIENCPPVVWFLWLRNVLQASLGLHVEGEELR